jgi:hypothetical protein
VGVARFQLQQFTVNMKELAEWFGSVWSLSGLRLMNV